jgi:hypothetical protein
MAVMATAPVAVMVTAAPVTAAPRFGGRGGRCQQAAGHCSRTHAVEGEKNACSQRPGEELPDRATAFCHYFHSWFSAQFLVLAC